jgi:histidyl-tRNA synthetase
MGSIGGGADMTRFNRNFWFENMVLEFSLGLHLLGGGRIRSFPETVTASSKALFINYGDTEAFYALKVIRCYEVCMYRIVHPDNAKNGKTVSTC